MFNANEDQRKEGAGECIVHKYTIIKSGVPITTHLEGRVGRCRLSEAIHSTSLDIRWTGPHAAIPYCLSYKNCRVTIQMPKKSIV